MLMTLGFGRGARQVYATGEQSVEILQVDGTEEEAKTIACEISCEGMTRNDRLFVTDNNQYTYYKAESDVCIKVSTQEPVTGIYCMFEKPCVWTLTLPDGSVRQGGENEFIHEYFELTQPVTGFELNIPADGRLTDVYAFSAGKLPDWVQVWQPPCERADLMLMPTHADDEHLWFGGAMPYYAGELGYQVQVVYLTSHNNATYRNHERLNGLWKVGVRNYPIVTDQFLDVLPTKYSMDAAERQFGRDNVVKFQVEMLRRFAPRVILAHDINGEYGHGAHRLNTSTLLEALELYEDPSVYPESAEKYGINKVQKCYLHLWSENSIYVKWSQFTLRKFDGKNAFQMALEGYHCHASQLRWNNHVEEWGKYNCCKFGLVYTTVGYDTPDTNDMFEHVDWSEAERPKSPEDEQPAESEPAEETESPSDCKVSDSDSARRIFGLKMSSPDVAVCGAALVLSLLAIIVVICLKRRK